ncbi:MAG: hypothetical protein M3Q10_18465 [Chloroflexota bacterium]|nr:hypothetical protein [Chloroflexota bacterium]
MILNPRPAALPVRADSIPPELVARDQWVCWSWQRRPDKPDDWTKVPVDPRTGGKASATDPGTWAPFAVALGRHERDGLAGIGFVVTHDDPYTGVDLDKCRDPASGHLAPWAAAIVAEFDSYAEVSPSGTGVRVWIVGSLDGLLPDGRGGRRKGSIEVYAHDRYFTVTGHALGEVAP